VIPVVAHPRKTTEQLVSDDQRSVMRQVRNVTAFASARDWTVDPRWVFVDDGVRSSRRLQSVSRTDLQ
jgi:hypothetical protein